MDEGDTSTVAVHPAIALPFTEEGFVLGRSYLLRTDDAFDAVFVADRALAPRRHVRSIGLCLCSSIS